MIFPFNAGEVFKIALKLEENGARFYEAAAAKPFPKEIKELFQRLGQEEKGHNSVFAQLLKKIPAPAAAATIWDPEGDLDKYLKMMADQHVFSQTPAELERLLEDLTDFQSAIKMAMSFEKDTIIFFMELLNASDDFGESRAQVQKLLEEERKHLRRLADMLK